MEKANTVQAKQADINYYNAIKGLIEFADSTVITELTLKRLIQQLGLDIKLKNDPGFMNRLIKLLGDVPIFATAERQGKTISSLRNLVKDAPCSPDKVLFSFLKAKAPTIKYV